MKKIVVIIQLIVGVIVILFALSLLGRALIGIVPSLKPSLKFLLQWGFETLNPWLQLILSLFIIQVVAVYIKKIFDKLNVSS